MLYLTPLLLLAAVQDPLSGSDAKARAEARGAARGVLEQLFAEDRDVYHHRDGRGHDRVEIDTRPRASDSEGICQIDRLEIERDSAGAIRKVETTHWFLVLTGAADKPRWDLEGEELEKSCAAAEWSDRWFEADEAFDAEAAVVALLALKKELLKAEPTAGVWGCGIRKDCPDPKAIGERIDPLNPQKVRDGGQGGVPCPETLYCVSVSLSHTDCDNRVTQLRLNRSREFRFHSARPGWKIHVLHCGEVPYDPGAEGS
jgi:hypothetical protein